MKWEEVVTVISSENDQSVLGRIKCKFEDLFDSILENRRSRRIAISREISKLAAKLKADPDTQKGDLIYVHLASALSAATSYSISFHAQMNRIHAVDEALTEARKLLPHASGDGKICFEGVHLILPCINGKSI